RQARLRRRARGRAGQVRRVVLVGAPGRAGARRRSQRGPGAVDARRGPLRSGRHRERAARPARMTAILLLALLAAAAPGKKTCADAKACAELARKARAGEDGPRDLAKAAAFLESGCAAGEPALCVDAGRAFLRGEGLKPDPQRAAQLFGRA